MRCCTYDVNWRLFSPNDFKNIIICFDDFERLSDKVPLKDVLGLISQFKEQKKCKVIMILNEGELDKLSGIDGKKHDEVFALYKEKVIDYTFHYKPSQEELFEAIKTEIEQIRFCDHQVIYDFFKKIDLKNIRTMKQALYQLKHFSFIENQNFDKIVVNEFVRIALNLFVFKAKSNYSYSDYQDIEEYEAEKSVQPITKNENFEINNKHEQNLKFYHQPQDNPFSELYYSQNKNVLEEIVYGFIDNYSLRKQDLQKQLEKNNQSLDWYDIRNEISELNTRFYTDFSVLSNEIAKQLFNLLNTHKDVIHRLFHYIDYKSFIVNINKFSQETTTEAFEQEIAKNYIAFYIDNPNYDISGPIDTEGDQLRLLTSDHAWAYTYISEYKKKTLKITPEELLSLIENTLNQKNLSEDDAFKINQISTEDCKKQIKENHNFIKPLVNFLKMPDSKNVRKNIIDALKSLKKENDDYAWKVEEIVKNGNIKLEENE